MPEFRGLKCALIAPIGRRNSEFMDWWLEDRIRAVLEFGDWYRESVNEMQNDDTLIGASHLAAWAGSGGFANKSKFARLQFHISFPWNFLNDLINIEPVNF
jgi:hypothetical protein